MCQSSITACIKSNTRVPEILLRFIQLLSKKRDAFLSLISNSRFLFTATSGTYFQMVNYREISNKTDTDFCLDLIKKHRLAAIPISVFNPNELQQGYIRFCFAKTDETLMKAAEIINQL